MPQVWTPDDLQFAEIRAMHFEAAHDIAGDLLAAAREPKARLNGVTAAEASFRAAELLIAVRDPDRAAMIARQVMHNVRSPAEKLTAACILARAGDQEPVWALAAPALSALRDRPNPNIIMEAVSLALSLANGEQFELATRVIDEANVAYVRWREGPGRRADRNGTLGNVTDLARQTVLTAHQDKIAGRRADEPGMQPARLPPWPASFGSSLVWWPEVEYQRIVRQVPDLRSVLGATWSEHIATVESAKRGLAGLKFLAADFGNFCGYLRLTHADPRLATTMTGFTAHLSLIEQPVPWPLGLP